MSGLTFSIHEVDILLGVGLLGDRQCILHTMVDSGLGALVFAMDLGLATVPRGQGEVSVFTAVDVELDKFVCVDAVVDAVFLLPLLFWPLPWVRRRRIHMILPSIDAIRVCYSYVPFMVAKLLAATPAILLASCKNQTLFKFS